MKIVAENDKLINDLYLDLLNQKIIVDIENYSETENNKKPMGACSFLVVSGGIIGGVSGIITIGEFLQRKYPEFVAYITTEKLTMTSDEYISMSETARKAVEKNFRVEIKKI